MREEATEEEEEEHSWLGVSINTNGVQSYRELTTELKERFVIVYRVYRVIHKPQAKSVKSNGEISAARQSVAHH